MSPTLFGYNVKRSSGESKFGDYVIWWDVVFLEHGCNFFLYVSDPFLLVLGCVWLATASVLVKGEHTKK